MSANELADELEERYLQGCIYQEAAITIRQLQTENDALKERIAYLESQVHGGTTQ